MRPYADGEVRVDEERRQVIAPVANGARLLADAVRDLDAAGVQLDDLGLRRPTLDDVFLALTGHAAETEAAADASVTAGGALRPLNAVHGRDRLPHGPAVALMWRGEKTRRGLA